MSFESFEDWRQIQWSLTFARSYARTICASSEAYAPELRGFTLTRTRLRNLGRAPAGGGPGSRPLADRETGGAPAAGSSAADATRPHTSARRAPVHTARAASVAGTVKTWT